MVACRSDPENAPLAGRPSQRSDEIGVAERELVQMQAGLRAALKQKTPLAAPGGAGTKINHDLRNILSTARLVSHPLLASADPTLRRHSPPPLAPIDPAAQLGHAT